MCVVGAARDDGGVIDCSAAVDDGEYLDATAAAVGRERGEEACEVEAFVGVVLVGYWDWRERDMRFLGCIGRCSAWC